MDYYVVYDFLDNSFYHSTVIEEDEPKFYFSLWVEPGESNINGELTVGHNVFSSEEDANEIAETIRKTRLKSMIKDDIDIRVLKVERRVTFHLHNPDIVV